MLGAAAMFDKSQIMKAAWAETKAEIARSSVALSAGSRRFIFRYHLKAAWAAAKRALRPVETGRITDLREQLFILENCNRWTAADYARADALHAEIREAA